MNLTELQQRCEAFLEVVASIYGAYLDATTGFKLVYDQIVRAQTDIASRFAEEGRHQFASIEYQDSIDIMYGKGDPNRPDAIVQHIVTQGEYKARNREGGENWIFLGNVCLVSIYQYWEDHFREEIATALGKTKNDIRVPVMGDLRRLRQSIIHNGGIAVSEVERCEVLRWYRRGERITLTADQIQAIVFEVKQAILTIIEQAEAF